MNGNGKKPVKYIIEYSGHRGWLLYMETQIFNLAINAYRTAKAYHKARTIEEALITNDRKVMEVE